MHMDNSFLGGELKVECCLQRFLLKREQFGWVMLQLQGENVNKNVNRLISSNTYCSSKYSCMYLFKILYICYEKQTCIAVHRQGTQKLKADFNISFHVR